MTATAITFEVKRKDASGWRNITVADVEGKTLLDLFAEWDGQEVVVKTDAGMICGTKAWLDYYRGKRHKVMDFKEAIERLRQKGLGDEVIVEKGIMGGFDDPETMSVEKYVLRKDGT